jgi:hypothetical protein
MTSFLVVTLIRIVYLKLVFSDFFVTIIKMASNSNHSTFCGSLRSFCSSTIFTLFHRHGGAAENLTSIMSKELDTHKPITFKKEIFHYLALYEAYPHHFLHVILHYDRQNVASNLYQLECFIENNNFVGIMSSFKRELIDQSVSYEKQNIRAYFYYLIIKARIKEKESTINVNQLTDRERYDFSYEKIFAKIKDNMYEFINVISFIEYSATSPYYELNRLIFLRRAKLVDDLFIECFALFVFLLAFADAITDAFDLCELNKRLVTFNEVCNKYIAKVEAQPFTTDFENKVKIYTKLYFGKLFDDMENIVASVKSGLDNYKVDSFLSLRKLLKLLEKNQVEGFFFLRDTIKAVERKITKIKDKKKEKERQKESSKMDELRSFMHRTSNQKSENSFRSRNDSTKIVKIVPFNNEFPDLMPIKEVASKLESRSFVTVDNNEDPTKVNKKLELDFDSESETSRKNFNKHR